VGGEQQAVGGEQAAVGCVSWWAAPGAPAGLWSSFWKLLDMLGAPELCRSEATIAAREDAEPRLTLVEVLAGVHSQGCTLSANLA